MGSSVYQKFITNGATVLTGVSIEVRKESDGTLAVLTSDKAGVTPISNPFTNASDGQAQFFTSAGEYKITATLGAFSSVERYVPIGTARAYDVDEDSGTALLTRAQMDLRYSVLLQNNLVATTDPAVTDDSDAGYSTLSTWFNTATGEIWRCFSAAVGAADWKKTTLTIDELGSAATLNAGVASGVATLDGSTVHAIAEVRPESVRYVGGYDVAGGTPAAGTKKDVYLLNGVGSLALTNGTAIAGMYIIYDGTEWLIFSNPAGGINWGAFNNGSAPTTAPTATATGSIAFGEGADATATDAISIGTATAASGNYSISIGGGTASGTDTISIGRGTASTGGICIGGTGTSASGNCVSIGLGTDATGSFSSAIGYGGNASGQYAQCFGGLSVASAQGTVVVGYSSTASATGAIAIGRDTTASASKAIAIGQDITAAYANSKALGSTTQWLGQTKLGAAHASNGNGTPNENSGHSISCIFGTTTSATPTIVSTLDFPSTGMKVARCTTKVVVHETATGEMWTQTYEYFYDNINSALIGTIDTSVNKTTGGLTLSFDVTTGTSNRLTFEATGEAAKTLIWVTSTEVVTCH